MDEHYRDPVLAAVYDDVERERTDLDPYLVLAGDGERRSAVDLGCGTGVLALRLVEQGWRVVGVDPAAASLDVARAKPGGHAVEWRLGDAAVLDPAAADLVVMTGNAAQTLVDDDVWRATLAAVRRALLPRGRFVFEVRDPAARAWEHWTRESTLETVDTGLGPVTTWTEVPSAAPPLVTYRTTYRFTDGTERVSTSRLVFRERAEVEADLEAEGFSVEEVTGAPDRPGLELVFTAVA